MTSCRNCGRGLTDPASIMKGVGPECAQAVGKGGTLRYRILEAADRGDSFFRFYAQRLATGKGLTAGMRNRVAHRLGIKTPRTIDTPPDRLEPILPVVTPEQREQLRTLRMRHLAAIKEAA